MAAIVKANPSLTAGGLAVLKRDFATTDRGQVTYTASYVCLSQFANTHAPRFQSGSEPPTPIPSALSLLNLTVTPRMIDLQSETANGLTYFTATYSAGVETDYVVTTATDQRNIAWISSYAPTFFTGTTPNISSFDYMSVSVTVEGTNRNVSIIPGSIGQIFNTRNVTLAQINSNTANGLTRKTIESTRQTRNQRGETFNSVTSTGVFEAQDATPSGTFAIAAAATTPTTATFPDYQQRNQDAAFLRRQSYAYGWIY